MGIVLHSEPELHQPDMIVGWPGIGNIGVITANALRQQIEAEEFGEIEPWDFFYPRKVIIKALRVNDRGTSAPYSLKGFQLEFEAAARR